VHVVAPHKGAIAGAGDGDEMTVDRSFLTANSVEADAIVVAGGTGLANEPAVLAHLQEAYRHHKTIGAWGDGQAVLVQAGIPTDVAGLATSASADAALVGSVLEGLSRHRHWERAAELLSPATVG
jgi:catalase